MNIIPTAVTAWRNERSIEDAITHHDKAKLGIAITLVLTFLVGLLKGTKYAQLVAFLDPDTLSAAGVLLAGVIAGFDHWATGGALVAASAATDTPASAPAAIDAAPAGVQPAPNPSPVPDASVQAGG